MARDLARRHGEVTRDMFNGYSVEAITNGVHAATWTGPHMTRIFNEHIPTWREDFFNLRYAAGIPLDDIAKAHRQAKHDLIDHLQRVADVAWEPEVLTLGYARRATAYKRPGLLFTDIDRLEHIASRDGVMQLVFAGKAHPGDDVGKHLIQDIIRLARRLPECLRLVYLPDYNTELARRLVAGVDVWINTPRPPLEASGTSGMKAALNGVPSLSTLDGWWIEGCIEGVTGWAIGEDCRCMEPQADDRHDAQALYDKLDHEIVPLFYEDSAGFLEVRRQCIALNGSFFNTHRMLQQYVTRAYL